MQAGVALVATIIFIGITREHPDPTFIGAIGALATILMGKAVTASRK